MKLFFLCVTDLLKLKPLLLCKPSRITATTLEMKKRLFTIHVSVWILYTPQLNCSEHILGQLRSLLVRGIVLLLNWGDIHMLLISGKNSARVIKELCSFSLSLSCLWCLNNICDFLLSSRSPHPTHLSTSRQMTCTWRVELQATSPWMTKMVKTMVQAPDLETMVRKPVVLDHYGWFFLSLVLRCLSKSFPKVCQLFWYCCLYNLWQKNEQHTQAHTHCRHDCIFKHRSRPSQCARCLSWGDAS